jgi:hypothetical protein
MERSQPTECKYYIALKYHEKQYFKVLDRHHHICQTLNMEEVMNTENANLTSHIIIGTVLGLVLIPKLYSMGFFQKLPNILSWLWKAFKRIIGFSIGLASVYGFIVICSGSNGLENKPYAQWTPNDLNASLGVAVLAMLFMVLAPLFFWLSCKKYRG